MNVDVGVEDVEDITFFQKGYWVTLISSHNVDAYLVQADSSPVNFNIKVRAILSFLKFRPIIFCKVTIIVIVLNCRKVPSRFV